MFLGILMSSDMERNRHIFTNLAIVLRLEETSWTNITRKCARIVEVNI
jgi:hypothetical protein